MSDAERRALEALLEAAKRDASTDLDDDTDQE